VQNQIQEISENAYKARKILRKSQKIHENSERQIGTRTIHEVLVLAKKILEPSNK
jgi:hypothetical protein